MKKKLWLLTILLTLVSCDETASINDSSNTSNDSSNLTSFVNKDDIFDKEARLNDFTLKDLDRAYNRHRPIESIGEPQVLVLPVLFKDSKMSEDEQKKVKEDLNKAFFGKSEDTGWESVSSFYQKSSYNRLNIKGEVAPFVTLDKTLSEVVNLTQQTNPYKYTTNNNAYYYDTSYYPLKKGLEILKKEHNYDYTKFDANRDGSIDAVWVIYGEKEYSSYLSENKITAYDPNYQKISSFLWAYTYWYIGRGNLYNPNPRTYAFASYNFMYTKGFDKVDAHTYIHETGHMLGLDDYYNYDYGNSLSRIKKDYSSPTGALDMMDNNIGDHNAFSKYLLKWVDPKIVNKEGTYTLSSFQNGGECLIIPSSTWNGSPYQEYLIIEYYTKDGLNLLDATSQYAGVYPILFQENGFKIYHVDARVGGIINNEASYLDNPLDYKETYKNGHFLGLINSNTPSLNKFYNSNNSSNSTYNSRLITLLSATGTNNYFSGSRGGRNANDKDLFKNGSSLNSYTFHNGNNLEFQISIGECNDKEGIITFKRG